MEKEAECIECNTNSVHVNLNVYVVSTYGPSLHALTLRRMAQLSANHLGSFRIESSVTDNTPGIIDADLHPSFHISKPTPTPSKPQLSMRTVGSRRIWEFVRRKSFPIYSAWIVRVASALPWHTTAASLVELHTVTGVLGRSFSGASDPVHCTLARAGVSVDMLK